MGCAPSSYLGNHYLSCLENKKITTLKPVYLVYWKDKDRNNKNFKNKQKGHLTFYIPEENADHIGSYKYADFIMEINCNLTFYIKDIIGYCYNEGGVFTYEFEPYFLDKVDISNCKIIKTSTEYPNKFNRKKLNLNDKVFIYDDFFHEEHCDSDFDDSDGLNELSDAKPTKDEKINNKRLKYLIENRGQYYKIEDLYD